MYVWFKFYGIVGIKCYILDREGEWRRGMGISGDDVYIVFMCEILNILKIKYIGGLYSYR